MEQEKILSDILRIAMRCVEYDPDSRPTISNIRDYIKFSNNSSFEISHTSGSDW